MGFKNKFMNAVLKVHKTFNEEAGTKQENKDLTTAQAEEKLTTSEEVPVRSREEEVGDIKIAREVICTVASQAAQEVPGVVAMSGGLADDVAKLMGKESNAKGVRVTFDTNGKMVDVIVYLVVEFGCNIPELALKVQEHVKSTVESMAGYEVQSVDVHIENVVKRECNEIELFGDGDAE